jgi:hypothetical protein
MSAIGRFDSMWEHINFALGSHSMMTLRAGIPPFPLMLYTKLQAVPRCSPFCNTRAPPPSLPKGDRLWEFRVAEAQKKQWAQMRDLAQIQAGAATGVVPHAPLLQWRQPAGSCPLNFPIARAC